MLFGLFGKKKATDNQTPQPAPDVEASPPLESVAPAAEPAAEPTPTNEAPVDAPAAPSNVVTPDTPVQAPAEPTAEQVITPENQDNNQPTPPATPIA